MPESMTRGKNQILFNYLPERTVDFPKGVAIARITEIVGSAPREMSLRAVVRRVTNEMRAWREENRPALQDRVLDDSGRFELLEPEAGMSTLFPMVFWCQNRRCGRIFDHTRSDSLPAPRCTECHEGSVVQLRFVKVHRCGNLEPLLPPSCRCAAGASRIALDTRQSERISAFRWVCRACGKVQRLWAGDCPRCGGTAEARQERLMEIIVHRAGRAYYPYTTTLLNIPSPQLQALVSKPEPAWAVLVAAKFLDLPEVQEESLDHLASHFDMHDRTAPATVSAEELAGLTARFQAGEISAEDMAAELQKLTARAQERLAGFPLDRVRQAIIAETGTPLDVWEAAGYDLLESLLPAETMATEELFKRSSSDAAVQLAHRLGLGELRLLTDFPVITATYGYSRLEYGPNAARLNPFPPDRRRGSKFPIFVDKVQADAIRIKLDQDRILAWMTRNGCRPLLPSGRSSALSRAAYFVRLAGAAQLRATLGHEQAELRMVFGLLHTLSHLCVRQAALLCGLERTSLSEYLLPRSLELILYCNHRSGATIGALTAMFEESVFDWLASIRDARRCVYDPVCARWESSCHACTHLAETSCRFFNLNLSRALLFGGSDPMLGRIECGYLDFA